MELLDVSAGTLLVLTVLAVLVIGLVVAVGLLFSSVSGLQKKVEGFRAPSQEMDTRGFGQGRVSMLQNEVQQLRGRISELEQSYQRPGTGAGSSPQPQSPSRAPQPRGQRRGDHPSGRSAGGAGAVPPQQQSQASIAPESQVNRSQRPSPFYLPIKRKSDWGASEVLATVPPGMALRAEPQAADRAFIYADLTPEQERKIAERPSDYPYACFAITVERQSGRLSEQIRGEIHREADGTWKLDRAIELIIS